MYQVWELGQTWESIYGVPFWELPDRLQQELTYLMQRQIGSANRTNSMILFTLQQIASRGM